MNFGKFQCRAALTLALYPKPSNVLMYPSSATKAIKSALSKRQKERDGARLGAERELRSSANTFLVEKYDAPRLLRW